jgi:hypothetical protein
MDKAILLKVKELTDIIRQAVGDFEGMQIYYTPERIEIEIENGNVETVIKERLKDE